ncbi:DoxX family protein [Leptobacterium flavescens]|uniref:DoxX family protein n=2 Tax=Leptobacterium flavescens TaxID=472055 RepID=A0A6P0UL66_9FLAO|nr:DoxX family protein [Leptobacterium flavescens]
MENITEILILLFLMITFLQSAVDKILDWKGNLGWLKGHFSKTFLRNMVPLALFKVLVVELIAGLLSAYGIYELIVNNDRTIGLYGAVFSCLALIMLLFGQRLAKDYDGARTIAIYFIVAMIGAHFLSQ